MVKISTWSNLGTKADLKAISDAHAGAQINFTVMPSDSVNYTTPFLYYATDASSIYGSSARITAADFTGTPAWTSGTEASVSFTLATVVDAMADASVLSYDAWGKCLITGYTITWTESDTTVTKNMVKISTWSNLGTKIDLKAISDAHAGAQINFTVMPSDSVNYTTPFLYYATDASSIYGSSARITAADFTGTPAWTSGTGNHKVEKAWIILASGRGLSLSKPYCTIKL